MTRRGLAVRPGEPDNDSHAVIEELLTVALDDARALIAANQPMFTAVVNQLLELETLELSDLQEIEAALSGDEHTEGHVGARTLQLLQQAGLMASDAVSTVGTVVAKVGRTALRHPVKGRKSDPYANKGDDSTTTKAKAKAKTGSTAKRKAPKKEAPSKPVAVEGKRDTKTVKRSELETKKKPTSRRANPKAPATE
jgi:hypothetical protein